jgi:2,3-bisphosphoglycerate-dependent phosphoglycerate mutase
MSRLIAVFLRHAELDQPKGVPAANLPHALTADGEDQATEAGQRLFALAEEFGAKIDDDIECSPTQAAWQTAAIIAEELDGLTGRDYRTVERSELAGRSLGSAANLGIRETETLIAEDPRYKKPPKGWLTQPDFRPPFPGAESPNAAGERVGEFVRRRAEEMWPHLTGDTLKLFVGHGSALVAAAAWLGAVPRTAPLKVLPHAQWALIEFNARGRCTLLDAAWRKPAKSDTPD